MTRKRSVFPVGAALLAIVAGCHPGAPTDKVAALVAKVTHGSAAVRTVFDGPPGSGLTGAVIAGGTHAPVVVWITADGRTLIAGNVFDARGRNLTQLATLRLTEAPVRALSHTSAAAASTAPPSPLPLTPGTYQTMERGVRFLREGDGKKSLWIFLDPNCPWCRRLYADLRAHPLPTDVSVNWVPVAFLKPSSVGRAESLLDKGLPALERNEDRFDGSKEKGGASETHRPDLEAAVKENTRILVSMGGTMTPTLVFRDKNAGVRRFDGYPEPEIFSRILSEVR